MHIEEQFKVLRHMILSGLSQPTEFGQARHKVVTKQYLLVC